MPVNVKCPACHAPHPKPVEYEAKVACELCGEEYNAPPPPAPKPVPAPASALPVEPETPEADLDFRPKSPAEKRARKAEAAAARANAESQIIKRIAIIRLVGIGAMVVLFGLVCAAPG